MRAKSLLPICGALFLWIVASCETPSSKGADVPCRCGTPMADFEGCAHPTCMNGHRNPANPDCVCGTIEIPHPKGN
ncbi:MAG: hypothetical protein JNK02_02000 [Planctomycetes bacterium]|nr:hypothetical protein [Planctomycetota bacterium]